MQEEEKKINFYYRSRQQYEKANKPFTYQLDLTSSQPKPRAAKFNILIKKFISIYKQGIKQLYDNQEDHRDNYWTQLLRKFLGRQSRYTETENAKQQNLSIETDDGNFQLKFVHEVYWQKPKEKIKKYFVLLLHTKKLFTTLESILKDMEYLYQNPQKKKQQYDKEIKYVDFLQDGQYKIMGDLITKYDQYAEQQEAERKIRRKQQEILNKQKQEEQRLRKVEEEKKRLKMEEEQKKRKVEEQRRRQIQEQMMKSKQQRIDNFEGPVITPDYFPQTYQAVNKDRPVMRKKSQQLNLPTPKQYHGKAKRSEILFLEQFKDQLEVFSYNLKPDESQQKQVCAACKKSLKVGVYFFGGNQNLCHYTGKWYCNQDMSNNRMPIPYKALSNFDLRGFSVCKTAYAELQSYFEKPILQITKDNQIIQNNKRLHDFLVLKRQIHLIYDSICNVDHIKAILRKKMNYCLKQNLFSLKNLYDIYNGQEFQALQRDYQILSRHFYRCDICQKKRGYICPKCKDPVKIFPFQLKQTHGCKICKKLFHRKCLPTGQCDCQE